MLVQAEDWPRVEALFEQALWLQRRGGASADGAVSLLYQYATVQYVRWGSAILPICIRWAPTLFCTLTLNPATAVAARNRAVR